MVIVNSEDHLLSHDVHDEFELGRPRLLYVGCPRLTKDRFNREQELRSNDLNNKMLH